MPNLSEVAGNALQHAIDNPRTTVQALLTSLMFLLATLLGSQLITGRLAIILGGVLASCKVGIGLLQFDGGPSMTLPPGTSAVVDTHTTVTTPESKS